MVSFRPCQQAADLRRELGPSTTTRGPRIVQNVSLPAGWLTSRSSGSKRSATGGLFQALSAGDRFKNHIISYHIISYHIISYHIISYHIISYSDARSNAQYHIAAYNTTLDYAKNEESNKRTTLY